MYLATSNSFEGQLIYCKLYRCTEYELSAKRQLQALSQPSEKVEERVKEIEVCTCVCLLRGGGEHRCFPPLRLSSLPYIKISKI